MKTSSSPAAITTLRIFKPRGRRAYFERFEDASAALAREAALRSWGYLVVRTEKAAPAKPKASERRKLERLRAGQRAVSDRLQAKRRAARAAEIEAFEEDLAARGLLDAATARRRAQALAPRFTVEAAVRASIFRSPARPVCAINVGRIRTIGNLARFFSVDRRIERATFEEALEALAAGALK